jgi:hypothetical protein
MVGSPLSIESLVRRSGGTSHCLAPVLIAFVDKFGDHNPRSIAWSKCLFSFPDGETLSSAAYIYFIRQLFEFLS